MESVEEYAKHLQDLLGPKYKQSNSYKNFVEYYKKDYAAAMAAEDPGNSHVPATPLLDILGVSIHRNESDDFERPFEICGTIQVIAEDKFAYDVYRRESNNPEIVSPGGELSLTHRDGTPSCLFLPCVSSLKMHVHLRDVARGKEIANQLLELKLVDNVVCEKIKTEDVQGHDAFASVQYVILPFAVIANIKLRLVKEDGSDFRADIYGSISATSKVQEGNISSVLLQKPPSEPIMVDLKTPLRLSKPVLAVPAYSSLQIKANLWDYHTKHQIASDVLVAEFQARDYWMSNQDCILGQNYLIQVRIDWSHAYVQLFDKGFPRHRVQPWCDPASPSTVSERGPLLYMGELLAPPSTKYVSGLPLVELFSISLFPDVNSSLFGKIEVYDSKGSFCIFKKDSSSKGSMIRDMKIECLKWPSRPFIGTCFGVRLHLTDGDGHEICKGSVDWDVFNIGGPMSWYNRRISSVVRGEHGYATVHHTIFENAMQATVNLLLVSNSSSQGYVVKGKIVAEYGSFMYSSYYHQKFFKSTLFGSEGAECEINSDAQLLTLQKSIVSVPCRSSLILEVELQVTPRNNAQQSIRSRQVFKIDVDNTSVQLIEGKDFHIIVFVKWTDILFV